MKGWLKYWRVVLALLTVFLAGGLIGFVAGASATKKKAQQLNMPENWAGLMLRRLEWELDLTPEQRQKVVPLLRSVGRDLYAVRRQAANSGMQRMRTFYAELDPILTPGQKHKLELSKERMRQRHKEGWDARPFGPGGPGGHGPGGPGSLGPGGVPGRPPLPLGPPPGPGGKGQAPPFKPQS